MKKGMKKDLNFPKLDTGKIKEALKTYNISELLREEGVSYQTYREILNNEYDHPGSPKFWIVLNMLKKRKAYFEKI